MHGFKLGILFVACIGWNTVGWAKQPPKAASSPVPIISSATALHDLMTAEFLAQERAYSAASKLYFPYAVNSPYPDVVERATTLTFLSGDLQQSARLAKHWLKIAPKDHSAYQILLTSQLNFEQFDSARLTLERYLKEDETEGIGAEPVLPVLKALMQRLGEEEAIDRLECFVEHIQDSATRYRLQLGMGIILLDAHNPKVVERGMKALEGAMAERPTVLEPAVHYALLMAKEEPEKAGKWLKDTVAKRSPTEANYLIVGFILAARQQLAFAEPVFQQATLLYPKNLAFQTLYLQSLLENRSYAAAQKTLVQLLGMLDPKEPRTTQMAIQLMRLAQTPSEREAAISFLKRVPDSDEYYEAVQEILLYQLSILDPRRAVTHLEELSSHPSSFTVPPSWWLFPAEAFHKQQKVDAALEVVERGLVKNVDSDELLEAKALLLSEMNRMGEAETVWRSLISRMPEQHSFYNNLGYVLLDKMGRISDAEPLILKAYALAPKDAAVLDSMGWLYYKLKQPKEGLKYLEEALKVGNPSDPEILLHLAEVCAASGDTARMKSVLEHIEKLKTKDWPPLQELRKRLGNTTEPQ